MTAYFKTIRGRKGFTLVEIMIVVLIIGVILAVAVPSWLGARERSQARTCQGQLREIKYAKESWAMDNHKRADDMPSLDDLYPTYLKSKPECPAGGTYTIGAVNEDPTCSIGGRHSLDWR
ncbi:MAG: prepilin-type N-terminal cleavage/methylation domain-containing protein [Armatimonadetes bacterium]|nr:prepilin-type N-terminal cleavage/methylation domain-containing protein [Armatimonadota bacterium]